MIFLKDILSGNKYMLPIGLGVIIILMILRSVIATSQFTANSEIIIHEAEHQTSNIRLLRLMSHTILERTIVINKMLHSDDIFEADEFNIELHNLATDYIQLRNTLEAQNRKNTRIITLLNELDDISRVNGPLQYSIYGLLLNNENTKAKDIFLKEVLPRQVVYFTKTNELEQYQFIYSQDVFNAAQISKSATETLIIFFDVVSILISFLLAVSIIRHQQASTSKLDYLARTDALTKLPNRTALLDTINHTLINYPHRPFALMFIDIDYFKSINDNYGHDIGDELLQYFSSVLSSSIEPEDKLSRFGGDEFVLLLRSIKSKKEAIAFTDKLSKKLDTSLHIGDSEVFITASIGACYNSKKAKPSDAKELLKHADIAMYSAKESGRNCYKYFSENTSKRLQREHEISYKLNSILKEDNIHKELFLLYQPLLNLKNNDIKECEVLLRWITKGGETISPAEFIPVAEKTNIVEKINMFVIEEACKQQRQWNKEGINNIRININLSGNKSIFINLLQFLQERVKEYGLNSSLFGIELIERALFDMSPATINELEKIREQGMKISIDDFGTGYSSLSYLKKLPITTIKIDQSFIAGLPHDKNDMALVKTIIQLGHSLKLDIVAEGVETYEQLQFLTENACTTIQGYYFHKPLEARQVTSLKQVA